MEGPKQRGTQATLTPGFFLACQERGTPKPVKSDQRTATPALPHDGGLQPQAETAAARAAPKKALQALGADVAEERELVAA